MKAAVIIVNWNGRKFLKDCLESIRVQDIAHHTIFVDNGSTDDSVQYVTEAFPEVELLSLKENLGFAKAANEGLIKALSDGYQYIALLNNDTKASNIWLSEMVKALENDDDAGICASKMLYMDDPEIINSTGHVKNFGEVIDRGEGREDNGQYDSKRYVFGACGGACMYKRQLLEEIGIFDGEYGSFYEDADLSWRAAAAGWKAIFEPKAVVYHKGGGTVCSDPDMKAGFDELRVVNVARLIKKNGTFADKLLVTVKWTLLYARNLAARALRLTKYRMVYWKRLKGIW